MSERSIRPICPAWFVVVLAQQLCLATILPMGQLVVHPAARWTGLAALAIGSMYALRTARTAEQPHCWTESPALVAMLAGLVGSGLWLGAVSAFLPVAGFVSVVSTQFAVNDETDLLARSGDLTTRR